MAGTRRMNPVVDPRCPPHSKSLGTLVVPAWIRFVERICMMSRATRTRHLDLRLSESDVALLRAAARQERETVSEFVRRVARRESKRVLRPSVRIVVSAEAMDEIQAAIARPAEPNEAWERAFASRRTLIDS